MLNVIFWDFWYIVYEIMNMVYVNNNVWKYVCIKGLKKICYFIEWIINDIVLWLGLIFYFFIRFKNLRIEIYENK